MASNPELQLSDKDQLYSHLVNTYNQRVYTDCSEEDLFKFLHTEIDTEISFIPTLWADLIYYFSKSEPENLFNREVQDLVYNKLVEMYCSKSKEFVEGLFSGLRYWFQGVRSYLEIADIIREIEPIDQLPEIKTRLFRIPTYSQILESILSNIYRFLREIIGSIKELDYTNQTNLGNLRDILQSNEFDDLFKNVDIDIRNAISHGGVIVTPWESTFIYTKGRNKIKNEKKWTIRDPIGETVYAFAGARKPHFDDFIEGAFDDAGGIIVGILRFFCKHPDIMNEKMELIRKDDYLSAEYLCRFFSIPGWICTNIDTGIVKSSSQLNIHFFVSESDHDQLIQHSLEVALIASEWLPNYQKYMIGYRHLRMMPGFFVFRKEELEAILNDKVSPDEVMKNVISRKEFRLFKASDEEIDLEAIRRFRYPLIDNTNWKLREIEDVSNEKYKRYRANLYVEAVTKNKVIEAVKPAIESLKDIENPPSPSMKIKHGEMTADAIYLHVFKKRSRRKNRVISINNPNFICLVEWHTEDCPAIKKGGIPDTIWDQLKIERKAEILYSWNPNFDV